MPEHKFFNIGFKFCKINPENWHPLYGPKSISQSFGKKSLQMGNNQKKCKALLKDARKLIFFNKINLVF